MDYDNLTELLAIKLCGDIEKAKELLLLGKENKIKSEYWQGVNDAIKALNLIIKESI